MACVMSMSNTSAENVALSNDSTMPKVIVSASSDARFGLPSTMPIENGKLKVAPNTLNIQLSALGWPGTYSDGGAPSRTISSWHNVCRLKRFGFAAELPYDGVAGCHEPHRS